MPLAARPAAGTSVRSHAERLLRALGHNAEVRVDSDHPALAWRRSGLMEITGLHGGPGLVCPVPITMAADATLAALKAIAPAAALPPTGSQLLGERARLLRLERGGATSPNGTCRLISTREGRIALSLARDDDRLLLPALFEAEAANWSDVVRLAKTRVAGDLVARARLLGLAAGEDHAVAAPDLPFRLDVLAPSVPRSEIPLVLDFGSLWAAPLAASLLNACGADVVKVESRSRPDGARGGNPDFYALLNAGKRSVALDFADPRDVAALRMLVRRADIVIEASRPRALRHLGLVAEDEAARGATWVSITAHGRYGAAAEWVGFGDDAAVAGGLSHAMYRAWRAPLFAGDAIADPLTGITAALAAWGSWRVGGGRIVSVPLSGVVAHACGMTYRDHDETDWQTMAMGDRAPLYPLRHASARPAPPGAHTHEVLTTLAGPERL